MLVSLCKSLSRSVVEVQRCEMNGSGDQLDQQGYCQLCDSLAVCLRDVEVFCDFFADDGGKGESRSHRDHVPDEE